jgi:hypothetical protein
MTVSALDEVITGQGFIQATEVWAPDASGRRLIRVDGLYGSLKDFEKTSAARSFARGEGLPGLAWEEARPILLQDIQGSAFLRTEAADRAGLAAAAAVPVFSRGTLKGVLVLLCGDDESRAGAIEIWRGDDASPEPMRLDGGYYGAARQFRAVSERTEFQRGQGLPGGVWASGAPMLMRDLGSASGFLRSAGARAAGLTTGLGLPVPTPSGESYVLTLLSAQATPIARRFEIWDVTPGKGGQKAVATLIDGLCETEGPLWGAERKALPWQGAVGRAMATGVPVAEKDPAAAPGTPRHAGLVALPIHGHGEVTRVVAWFF